ncbi:hypothetical protein V6L77_05555 [Pannonibacter sp. Pt2-lr]
MRRFDAAVYATSADNWPDVENLRQCPEKRRFAPLSGLSEKTYFRELVNQFSKPVDIVCALTKFLVARRAFLINQSGRRVPPVSDVAGRGGSSPRASLKHHREVI